MINHAQRLLAASYDGDTLYHVYNNVDCLWVTTHSGSLKIKIFGVKLFYRPSKWPGIKNELPSRTKFRKLSKRQQRIIAKRIEKYIMDVEENYVKLPE